MNIRMHSNIFMIPVCVVCFCSFSLVCVRECVVCVCVCVVRDRHPLASLVYVARVCVVMRVRLLSSFEFGLIVCLGLFFIAGSLAHNSGFKSPFWDTLGCVCGGLICTFVCERRLALVCANLGVCVGCMFHQMEIFYFFVFMGKVLALAHVCERFGDESTFPFALLTMFELVARLYLYILPGDFFDVCGVLAVLASVGTWFFVQTPNISQNVLHMTPRMSNFESQNVLKDSILSGLCMGLSSPIVQNPAFYVSMSISLLTLVVFDFFDRKCFVLVGIFYIFFFGMYPIEPLFAVSVRGYVSLAIATLVNNVAPPAATQSVWGYLVAFLILLFYEKSRKISNQKERPILGKFKTIDHMTGEHKTHTNERSECVS